MPVKKYNKKYKKKTYKKKNAIVPLYNMLKYSCFGFPDKFRTKIRYHSVNTVNSTAGAIAKQQLRANSVFDPDFTGAGHQPLYFDTFSAIYDHYVVISSKVVARFTNTSTTTGTVVGINLDDDSTISTTLDTLTEASRSPSTYLTPLTGSKNTVLLKNYFSYKKQFASSPFASLNAKTDVTTNPAELSVFNLYNSGFNGGTATCDVEYMIEFDVLFSELSTPVQS